MCLENNYSINKVLNNNIVLATNLITGEDQVLIGKGIGFGKKAMKKTFIATERIDRAFIAFDEKLQADYYRIVKEMDIDLLEICERIISLAENQFGELSEKIHVLLVDHISFALERVSKGQDISNPFIDEIRIIYPDEFKIAKEGIKMIDRQFGINLGYSEVGFIAMHIHSARRNSKVSETIKNARILNEVVDMIEADLGYKLDRADYKYKRLVNHIQGAMDRINIGKDIDNPLITNIKKEFKDSFKLIYKIKDKLESEYGFIVPEPELGYMAIHIQRLKIS